MTTFHQPDTCPHCGAARGLSIFCSACGCRLAGRPPGAARYWAVAITVALIAAPLILISLQLSICGCVATVDGIVSSEAGTLLSGLAALAIGFTVGRWAVRLMRAGQARIDGCREVGFGRPNRRLP